MRLTEEQQSVKELFHEFARDEIRPQAADLDANPRFPSELFDKAGELGFFSMRYPEPDGAGADLLSYLLAVEEIAWGSLAVACCCTMQSLMGTFFIQRFAKGELRERIVAKALAGEVRGTICMTEPDSGSDLFSMSTRAEQSDDGWKITGAKTWITSAPVADLFTVFARTGEKELGIFLVEKGAAGLHVGRALEKTGVKASLTSELSLEDTPAILLGEQGGGISAIREILVVIRLMTAALALGVARAAIEDAVKYSIEREQFGRPIGKFQAVQMHLAEMKTIYEAARALTFQSARDHIDGKDCVDTAAMSKLFASESAVEICDRAVRIHASYGYSTEYAVERYLRDARFTLIGGGTSEILKVNIAKGMTR
ncbi:MAG: acyl-CoA dehydrogenase family protein [Planctomycetota bacterium]|jgi:butyryl-CoA dehydrogenase